MTNRVKLIKANVEDYPQIRGQEINKAIEEKHPNGDEFCILRRAIYALAHGQPVSEEFEAYYREAEKAIKDFDDMVKG